MSRRLADFGLVNVVVITFTEAERLAAYEQRQQLSFPVLRDPNRDAYRAYGLQRASLVRVWGWRAIRRYVEIFRADGLAGLHRPVEDTRQLGGNFVIDRAGTLTFAFWGEGPDDRPSVDALVDAARNAG